MAKPIDTDTVLQKPWGDAGPSEALDQLAKLAATFMSAAVKRSADRSSFRIEQDHPNAGPGIEALNGRITAANALEIKVRLVTLPDGIRVGDNFVKCLLETSKEFQLAEPPPPGDSANREIWFEFQGKASPLGPSRESAFLKRLETLNDRAKRLQADIPVTVVEPDLDKIYKDHLEYLNPVYPCGADEINGLPTMTDWAQENYDLLAARCSVAIVSPDSVLTDFGLAIMAFVFLKKGSSLGRFVQTQLTTQLLLEMANKAPGIIVVPADRLTMGTNPYSMGRDVQSLFSSLKSMGRTVLFTGTFNELRTALGRGQGGKSDPLEPVVRHIPGIPMETLAQFAVRSEARRYGGLSRSDERKLAKEISDVLAKDRRSAQHRLLSNLVSWTMAEQSKGRAIASGSLRTFLGRLQKPTETLGGLGHRPKTERAPHVQRHFLKVLDDPGLIAFFRSRILGQDRALEQIIGRLLEMVTAEQKLYRPLCYLAQGTTGTGKSESARLLARALGIPLHTINVASMKIPEMANTRLYGSSPGFVGSYESGILEKLAKEHLGVVVEVMDLDHAPPEHRSGIADEFLQVLDDGVAESGSGTIFSCANLIFAFTSNLPEGRDEKLRRSMGFGESPSLDQIESDVRKEVKSLFSPAFLGRVGDPILFGELDHETLAIILEKAVATTIRTIADRHGEAIGQVVLENGLGMAVVSSSRLARAVLGARSFMDLGRSLGAKAYRQFRHSGPGPDGNNLIVSRNNTGELLIEMDQ
ncbi:hypothetical protein DSCO28_12310 [Desulfosarcina ovata subsp. sediminis]|uniref:ATPase AAA-type core domain-containing protein n=1 Tax=Desulfosarcina ovata subsp. sediminis TaxID=885957 RepID=A0A5K7ZK93_9BACT|nr:AAA family ATPase [Desulfosarcina ovata]BBO80665.1 hypothetical protein DSCO28_12310 [Desulfosarcina ovata subsp. sediminis]